MPGSFSHTYVPGLIRMRYLFRSRSEDLMAPAAPGSATRSRTHRSTGETRRLAPRRRCDNHWGRQGECSRHSEGMRVVVRVLGIQRSGWRELGTLVARQTGSFSEINMHEVIVPVGNHVHRSSAPVAVAQNTVQQEGQVVDHKRRALGLAFTEATWRRFSGEKHHPGLIALGYTLGLKGQCVEQFNTSEWWMDMPLYFVWARKSV